jgi:hypothetical protein
MSDRMTRAETKRPWQGALVAAAGLILFAALMRLVPHPWNFTPVAAMALFGGMVMRRPLFAFGVPLAALVLSDLFINAWVVGSPLVLPNGWVYGTFILIGLLGFTLRKRRSVGVVAAASISGSVLFFALTNFGVWASGLLYPRTSQGLAACYTAAIPFFANTLMGDLFWNAVLFGAFYGIVRLADRQETVAGRA